MAFLLINASQVLTLAGSSEPRRGKEMSSLGLVREGAVLIEEGRITAAGTKELVMRHAGAKKAEAWDAGGRVVLPGFVDSHSHPVFAAPRLNDFEARLKGKDYVEIAAAGGGILSTVDGVRGASEPELLQALRPRLRRFLECGTTTLEAKSGYGLDLGSELKILRVLRAAGEAQPLEIVSTFLGAHALPPERKGRHSDYVKDVVNMIPAVAKDNLARFADVFLEKGYFSAPEARQVLAAASQAGLRPKLHADQLSAGNSAALAVELNAASADHLDFVDAAGINKLAASLTLACLVPGSNYFLGKPYPPARRLIDGRAAVALATDFNPGTCPCWDMRMILSIACAQMRMTPAEAIVAATINGAHALGLGATHGSLESGKYADILVYDAEDYREIPYYFGSSQAHAVIKRGELVYGKL